MILIYLIYLLFLTQCNSQMLYTKNLHFRVDPGDRTCFYETAKSGQMMEVYYQVLDGQQGELDISVDVFDANGNFLASDYKKSQNSIIRELNQSGDYAVCLDNSYSLMNSKLVFIYIMLEDTDNEEAEVSIVDDSGREIKEAQPQEVLHWKGSYDNGEPYYVQIEFIADSLSRTLKHVLSARHMLDLFSATRSRDSYSAFKDTHRVDTWSAFQIGLMCFVGLLQVFMIKSLFNCRNYGRYSF